MVNDTFKCITSANIISGGWFLPSISTDELLASGLIYMICVIVPFVSNICQSVGFKFATISKGKVQSEASISGYSAPKIMNTV